MYSGTDFKLEIETATRHAIKNLKKKHPSETFCAFGLYSDEGALTICFAANTEKHLRKKMADSSEDGVYYKWMTPEWKYENVEQKLFDSVVDLVKKQHEAIESDDEFEIFRNYIFEACVQSLESLRNEGLFGEEIIVFEVSGFDDEAKLVSWMYRLNNKTQGAEFEELVKEE